MKRLYHAVGAGLMTIALAVSYPNMASAENSGSRQEKKSFAELVEEKWQEKDYESMEKLLNKRTDELSQETEKLNSWLEECIQGSPDLVDRMMCHYDYTIESDYLRKPKSEALNLLKMLSAAKTVENNDYEGAEATLKEALSLVVQEIEMYKFGLKGCDAYIWESKGKCEKMYNSGIDDAKGLKAEVFYLLGWANEAMQDSDSALSYYQQANELDPKNQDYKQKVEELTEKPKEK